MTFEQMELKAESFFGWPTDHRDTVTLTSAILFAQRMYDEGAAYLPRRSMFESGVETGRKEAAEEIITLIDTASAITGGGNHYNVSAQSIKDAIRKKYGVK